MERRWTMLPKAVKDKAERDLMGVLQMVRDLRAAAVRNDWNPWAVRQGLVTALIFDYYAALGRGIPDAELKAFDAQAMEYAKEVLRKSGDLQ